MLYKPLCSVKNNTDQRVVYKHKCKYKYQDKDMNHTLNYLQDEQGPMCTMQGLRHKTSLA